jgi:type IV secretion system protein TrbE
MGRHSSLRSFNRFTRLGIPMLDAMINACSGLIDLASGRKVRRISRVSRLGMPNGFFLNNLIWFGDGASHKTAISRGFVIEPGEISAFSVRELNSLHEKLRIMLGTLGQEYHLQIQWSIDSDYRQELERYHQETLELRRQDPIYGRFGVFVRAERYERYKAAMHEGRLRRERLNLFFTRIIDTKVGLAGRSTSAEYFDTLSRKEALSLQEFALGSLSRLFPDCRIVPMKDEDHFLFYHRFLNPNLEMSAANPLGVFDSAASIQQNCLHTDGIAGPAVPGVSLGFDGFYHAIVAVRQWPRRTFPELSPP